MNEVIDHSIEKYKYSINKQIPHRLLRNCRQKVCMNSGGLSMQSKIHSSQRLQPKDQLESTDFTDFTDLAPMI